MSSPRFHMTIIVLATAAAGFLCSYALLRLGLHRMWLRYAVSVIGAYVVFLFLVWLWLMAARSGIHFHVDLETVLDGVDLASSGGPPGGGVPTVDLPDQDLPIDLGLDLGVDEVAVVILIVVAVGSALIAAAFVVYSAPTLLAEVLLDGALAVGLLRRMRRLEQRHWIESAVLRTRFPLFWVLFFFIVAGLGMQWYAPQADSIGDVWLRLAEGSG